MSNSQTPNNPPVRKRIMVHTASAIVPPGQVAAHREAHARAVFNETNNNVVAEQEAPEVFNPQQVNRRPNLPPGARRDMQQPPSPPKVTMDDVMGAFAKAGQKASKVTTNPTTAINPPAEFSANEPDVSITESAELNNLRVEEPIIAESNSFRVDLPSNNVFYQLPALSVRPFDVPELAKLYRARMQRSQTLLIDCVNSVCDGVDVRDLTPRDFRYILYQLRINSFLRTPYKLTFSSFYGNRNEFVVNNSNLAVKLLDATPDDYAEWQDKGLTMFTVRDQEEYDNSRDKLGEDAEFYWSRAKYCPGRNVAEKIKNFRETCKEQGIDFIFQECELFSRKFEDYGVTESIELQDKFFNAQDALTKLNAEANSVAKLLENQTLAVSVADAALTRLNDLQNEINRINQQILTTGEAAPRRETIEFSIEVADFFPAI